MVTKAADALAGDVFDPDCPSRVVLDRLGDKWTALIVLALAGGTLRFGELRERVGQITPKVLSQSVRALETDGLLTRQVFAEVPPRTQYTLTPLGRSLLAPLSAIAGWAEQHVSDILTARAKASTR